MKISKTSISKEATPMLFEPSVSLKLDLFTLCINSPPPIHTHTQAAQITRHFVFKHSLHSASSLAHTASLKDNRNAFFADSQLPKPANQNKKNKLINNGMFCIPGWKSWSPATNSL